MNRETMLIAAVVVCVIGTLYLYRELKNTKNEVMEVKAHSGQMAQYLSSMAVYGNEEDEDEEEETETETEMETGAKNEEKVKELAK